MLSECIYNCSYYQKTQSYRQNGLGGLELWLMTESVIGI